MDLYEKIIAGEEKVSLVGLGYVGMPIAVAFAKKIKVVGFDLNAAKIDLYKKGIDPTNEVGNDVIANTTGYTYLINRHIDKENTVVFTFGEKNLDEKVQEVVNEKTRAMEDKATAEGLQDKYLKMLSELESKYVK